jgi:hypothetical protein
LIEIGAFEVKKILWRPVSKSLSFGFPAFLKATENSIFFQEGRLIAELRIEETRF